MPYRRYRPGDPRRHVTRMQVRKVAIDVSRGVRVWFTRSYVPEIITVICSLAMAGIGVTMLVDHQTYSTRPSLSVAMGPEGWMQPQAWGVLVILPAVATILSLASGRRDVYWPIAGMVVWLAVFSLAGLISTGQEGAVQSVPIIYSAMALMLTTLAIMYSSEGRP